MVQHYVANSMDGTTELDGEHHDRNHVDSIVPMQDLIDSYMLPFQACVEKGLICSVFRVSPESFWGLNRSDRVFGFSNRTSVWPDVLIQCGQRGAFLCQRLAAQ